MPPSTASSRLTSSPDPPAAATGSALTVALPSAGSGAAAQELLAHRGLFVAWALAQTAQSIFGITGLAGEFHRAQLSQITDQVAMLHLGRLVMSAPLDQILDEHHVLTIQFPDSLATAPNLAGGLGWRGEGREWTCVCNGELEQLRSAATTAGASIVEQRRPSLEDVFLARARSITAGRIRSET